MLAEGYSRALPEPLVSPAFPDTFAASAFHALVRDASGVDAHTDVPASFGSQWVYRHVDLDLAAHSPAHLVAFRMVVALASHPASQRPSVLHQLGEQLARILRGLGLDLADLRVTCFAGDATSPFDCDGVRMWRDLGLVDDQIVSLRSRALCGLDRPVGELTGPRSEIFAAHPRLGFIEVGTLVTESHLLSTGAKLVALPRQVSGFALGLERLALVANANTDICQVVNSDWLRLREQHPAALTHSATLAGLFKALHAADVIAREQNPQWSAKHWTRWRQLLRYLRRQADAVGIANDDLGALAQLWLPESGNDHCGNRDWLCMKREA